MCAGSDTDAPPRGLSVFHIEADGKTFALLVFEAEDAALLTPAEREVMAAILEGKSNAEVAAARGTSPRTIANQIARLFRKLGVRSRAGLAARARRMSVGK